jgi:predicted Fe-Mo cluster-binding NifX family protein
MKIILPADENNNGTTVCVSFGRAPFFMIYDTESKQASFKDNPAASSPGGAGVKAAQFVVDSGAEVLLTPRCGDNAAEVLSADGTRIYKTRDGTAMDNIEAFLGGELTALTETHPGFHGHGNG